MAREVINIIERRNIIFIFREITLDSCMLSHSVRRDFVLKIRLTREEKEKDPRAGATYLLEDKITLISNAHSDSLFNKHDQVSMFIFSSNCYGWTRWLDWQIDSIVGQQNIKKKIGI